MGAGVSPNSNGGDKEGGVSALSAAASSGHFALVKLLLERGADVNAEDAWGANALVGASDSGNVDTVKLLLARGADPNIDDDGLTALDKALHEILDHETDAPISNYRIIVDMLVSRGARACIFTSPLVRLLHVFP